MQECTLRVYSRDSRPAAVAAVQQAFDGWLSSRFGGRVLTPTPSKLPRPANGRAVAVEELQPLTKRLRSEFEAS